MECSSETTPTRPAPVTLSIAMMGLSAGFMVLHFVLNRLRTPDARIPPLSVIITGTFACLFVGLILSKP